MPDELKTDLALIFKDDGTVDLDTSRGEMTTASSKDNLVQSLRMRLLVYQGELSGLGHTGYGTRIQDLLGEPMDRANIELMRRYVRRALLQDPRVVEVIRVVVTPRRDEPGAVDVDAAVSAISGDSVDLTVTLAES
jgi:phage baseplate assembly protein W